ncbi:MAG TPA: hypothetical protein VI455_19105 [Terriglobia bacterium]
MLGLLELAQELEWQVLQLRRVRGGEMAAGELEKLALERQRTLIATADKIQRELLDTVRFDPLRLVGVGGPIDATLDAVGDLVVALDEIRQNADDVSRLPFAVRSLQSLLKDFCQEGVPVAA